MSDESAEKPKMEMGSFSMRFLKSLFLKETTPKIKTLAKDFVNRRYYQTDSEVSRINVAERDTSHEKLTDIYISDIRNITKEKMEVIKKLSDGQGIDSEFDSFIDKNSKENPPRIEEESAPQKPQKKSKAFSGLDNIYNEIMAAKASPKKSKNAKKFRSYEDSYDEDYIEREKIEYNPRKTSAQPAKKVASSGKTTANQYGNSAKGSKYESRKVVAETPVASLPRKKNRSYTAENLQKDFGEIDHREFTNIDNRTRRDLEEYSRKVVREKDVDEDDNSAGSIYQQRSKPSYQRMAASKKFPKM
ncbi:MAG: hypothetical protein LBQ34_01455 [Alphaproteobacteria bacterium]|jgi:hypothetical protein|nr:hypothetical protein [Alphaproteobacteria bacterium]